MSSDSVRLTADRARHVGAMAVAVARRRVTVDEVPAVPRATLEFAMIDTHTGIDDVDGDPGPIDGLPVHLRRVIPVERQVKLVDAILAPTPSCACPAALRRLLAALGD